MSFAGLNYIAIVIAAVAGFGVGAVWYTFLFQKPWMAAMGMDEEKMRAGGGPDATPFIVAAVGHLVMAFVFSAILHSLGAATLGGGLTVGFFAWLGFVITSMAVNNGFGGRNMMVTVIDGGHWLTVLLVMGLIIGAFG
jgi:hypothetical protein